MNYKEIEYRAWDIFKQKMFPVKGLSFDYCSEMGIKNEEIGVVFGEPYSDEFSIEDRTHLGVANHHPQVDSCILLEYIGHRDKNDKKICQGDICKNGDWEKDANAYNYRIEEVKWDKDNAMWIGWNPNTNGMTCEIIGNVYENPELLEGGDKK